MPLFFRTDAELKDYINNMYMGFIMKDDFTKNYAKNVSFNAVTNYLTPYVNNGNYINDPFTGENNSPAGKLINWINTSKEVFKLIDDARGDNLTFTQRKEKMAEIEAKMELLTSKDIKAELRNFYEDNKYYKYTDPAMKFLSSVINSVYEQGDIMKAEKQNSDMELLTDELTSLGHEREALNEEEDLYNLELDKNGLFNNMLKLKNDVAVQKKAALEKSILYYSESKELKKDRNDFEKAYEEIENSMKKYQGSISQYEKEARKYELIYDDLKSKAFEIKGINTSLENDRLALTNEENNLASLDNLVAQSLTDLENHKKDVEFLKKIENDKNKMKIINNYDGWVQRKDKFGEAMIALNDISKSGVDMPRLFDLYKNNFEGLNKDEYELIRKYSAAREQLITNFSSNEKEQNKLRLEIIKLEETKDFDPIESISTKFGDIYAKELVVLNERIAEAEMTYPDLVTDYRRVKALVSQNKDYEGIYNNNLRLQKEAKEHISELKAHINLNEKKLKEFSDTYLNKLNVNYDKSKTYSIDEITKVAKTKYEQNTKLHNEIVNNPLYKDLAKKEEQVLSKIREHSKDKALVNVVSAKEELKEIDKELKLYNGFIEKENTLKAKMVSISSRRNEIYEKYKALAKKDTARRVENRLSNLSYHLFDKSMNNESEDRTKNSPEFNRMHDSLESAINVINDRSKSNLEKRNALETLRSDASSYLDAKKDQIRFWPFSSEKRYQRISTAKEIMEYAASAIKAFSKEEVSHVKAMTFLNNPTNGRILVDKDVKKTFESEMVNSKTRIQNDPEKAKLSKKYIEDVRKNNLEKVDKGVSLFK